MCRKRSVHGQLQGEQGKDHPPFCLDIVDIASAGKKHFAWLSSYIPYFEDMVEMKPALDWETALYPQIRRMVSVLGVYIVTVPLGFFASAYFVGKCTSTPLILISFAFLLTQLLWFCRSPPDPS